MEPRREGVAAVVVLLLAALIGFGVDALSPPFRFLTVVAAPAAAEVFFVGEALPLGNSASDYDPC